MPCGIYWRQRTTLEKALGELDDWGIEPTTPWYQRIWESFKGVIASIGQKLPRISVTVKVTYGHSPGIFTLRLDPESGWFVEARERPAAPPIYKAVSSDIARAILKDELTDEQELYLLAPDDYLGE